MADEAQLAILKQGVEVWNKWRAKNPDAKIDLSNTDLTAADLSGADLSHANLCEAHFIVAHLIRTNLSEADLERAHFRGTDLSYADFRGADLNHADLSESTLGGAELDGADLSHANLSYAHLYEAHLIGTRLFGTNLSDADLNGANLSEGDLGYANFNRASLRHADLSRAQASMTTFDDIDLSQVKGLETVTHHSPSSIGIDTIYKSKGNIPEIFLRGCGVPDNFIVFMHSLAGQAKAFDFYSCFISYSSKDEDFAKRLYNDLQGQGVRCWFALEDLKIGDKFPDRIEEAIRVYDKLMLLLSTSSINSGWVRKEVRTALSKEKQDNHTMLFPIRLDDAFMDTTEDWADEIRRTRHTGDFRNWKDHDCYQQAFTRLLRDLQAESVKK